MPLLSSANLLVSAARPSALLLQSRGVLTDTLVIPAPFASMIEAILEPPIFPRLTVKKLSAPR